MDRVSRCTPGLVKSYDPVKYRVVFASGSPIGIPFLEALAQDPRYEVVGVLTMPDMPSGRGMKMQENVIGVKSYELWITSEHIHKPHSLRLDSKKYSEEAKKTYARLQSLDIDILYVVAYGNLLPQHILDIPKIAPINIHGSLLPAYRGASPLQQVFIDGLPETGVTLMKMEAGLDSGPMIDKQIFKLGFSDTVADLIQRVKEYTPKWSLDSIDAYVHGELQEELQEENQVTTHCGKIEKEDGLIKISNWKLAISDWEDTSLHSAWQDSLEIIYRKYKWYYLWPKIYTGLETKSGKLRMVIEELVLDEALFAQYKDDGLLSPNFELNPAVLSLKVKPEGKKVMWWEDFRRGYL